MTASDVFSADIYADCRQRDQALFTSQTLAK